METSSTSNSSNSSRPTSASSSITVSLDTVPPRSPPFWPLRPDARERRDRLRACPRPPLGLPPPTRPRCRSARGSHWTRGRDGDVVRAGEERLARTLVTQGLVHLRTPPVHSPDDVEVVIPVVDDAVSLERLLGALAGLRVTVVDDASSTPRVGDVARVHGARLVRLALNAGPGVARNAGVAASDRPLVWFLDVDVDLEDARGLLDRLLGAFADPAVGAAAPRVRGPRTRGVREGFEHRHGALDLGALDALVVPGAAVAYVPGACLLVRRDALGEGFDPALRVGEDVDFVWRLHDRGWLVRYLADATATHAARPTWAGWVRQRAAYGRSSGELARRHGRRVAPVRVDAATLLAWGGAWAGAPL